MTAKCVRRRVWFNLQRLKASNYRAGVVVSGVRVRSSPPPDRGTQVRPWLKRFLESVHLEVIWHVTSKQTILHAVCWAGSVRPVCLSASRTTQWQEMLIKSRMEWPNSVRTLMSAPRRARSSVSWHVVCPFTICATPLWLMCLAADSFCRAGQRKETRLTLGNPLHILLRLLGL